MKRRTFLKTAAGAAGWLSSPWGWAAEGSSRALTDEEWLARARQRLEEHRQGPGVIVVRDANGMAVPGARVEIEQVRHEFLFGSNFFMFGRVGDPALEEAYRSRFKALLNYATLGFYWAAYEHARGHPNHDYIDTVAAWCREHGIKIKGHPLAWDHPASSPKWLPEHSNEVAQLSTARVRQIVERFRDRIDWWDVVNEPTDLTRFPTRMNTWARVLGAVPFTRLHLQVARAANPKATLLVNDYRADAAFHRILEELRQDGRAPFDAVGIQSHMHDGGWPLRKIWEVCDRFADLGVPLHFTETTVVSGPRRGPGENWHPTGAEGEARQADYVPNFYTMLFGHPAVEAVTWWDFSDRGAWQRAAAGWLRADMTPKPVYGRLEHLIRKQWWTRMAGVSNAQGEFAARAYFGVQRLTAGRAGGRAVVREVSWQRGHPNRFEVVVA